MKLNAKLADLRMMQDDTPQKGVGKIRLEKDRQVGMELDIRGMLVDDAILVVDRYIDNAVLSGLTEINIIHGKGTGALRAGIQDYLRTNKRVKSFRLGNYGEGDAAPTATYRFEYDSLGRLIRSQQRDGNTVTQRTEQLYDTANRLSAQGWTLGGTSYRESYAYDASDGSLTTLNTAVGTKIGYNYDALKRLRSRAIYQGSTPLFENRYAYATQSGNQSTALVEFFNYRLASDDGNGDIAPAPPDGADDSQTPQAPPDDKIARREGPFTAETPFSTRFFVLHYASSGTLTQADLDNIASVTEDDTQEYLSAALAHGAGYGYFNSYRFFVAQTDDGENIAIFLDCYHELRAMRVVLMWSLLADAACVLLVFLLVMLFSRRAIDPVVRSAQQQKQFITDASHELKTPITVIATSLKVLEMETGKQKWIDKAMAQTEKLTSLVNSLVTLSRMDEEDSPLRMEDFPVSDAVRETAESFVDFAASKGHELRLSITDGLTYRGDEYAVRQLVSILLDNAVKYALPDSPIEFSLEKAKRGVVLRSSNACEDVAPENAQKLFDRFYRADQSRSSGSGFGIGLSIARSIAEGHHGSIRAIVDDGKIAFTAELK